MRTRAEQEAMEDEAAEWVVRRDAGFAPGQQAEFERWLAADPRHYATFAEMDAALGTLNGPRVRGRAPSVVRELTAREDERRRLRPQRRRTVAFATLGVAAAVMVVFTLSLVTRRGDVSSAPATATMQLRPEQQHLPDGSIVELNANSGISVDFTTTRRGVRLVSGEAHFAVAKDSSRPFVVLVGNIEVRAVGTAFAVRFEPTPVDVVRTERVEVLVTEGKVAVQTAQAPVADPVAGSPESAPVFVSAGGRLAVLADGMNLPAAAVEAVTPAEISTALSWREAARFEFTNTPLSEAVALFNRKSRVKLFLDDPALADLRVSGIYRADNPDGFARLIGSSLDIEAVRDGTDRIVLHRRR